MTTIGITVHTAEQRWMVQMSDLINRQDAINLLKKWSDGYDYIEIETESAIKEFQHLPSAQSESVRRGRWITSSDDNWVCSECGASNIYAYSWNITGYKLQDHYCPWCGALMEE